MKAQTLGNTVMYRVLGSTSALKVLDYLIAFRKYDVTITDIQRGANVGRKQIYESLDNLVGWKLVKRTRKIGRSWMYQLNLEDEVAQAMTNVSGLLVERAKEVYAAKA
jgi:DNA-binding IclR family transcriptional regulator